MFDPTNYTSDGTILEVVFGRGPDTSKYMKYIKEGMLYKTYTVEVVDNRIYAPRTVGGYPESILATRLVDGIDGGDDTFIEVIYPRDLIRKVN